MGFFNREKKKSKPSFSFDQAVIITIRLDDSEESTNDKEFEKIQNLEKDMAAALPVDSGVDGDDFGDGECIVYVYGPSADNIWQAIEGILKKTDFNYIEVMLQYGEPGVIETKTKSFTI